MNVTPLGGTQGENMASHALLSQNMSTPNHLESRTQTQQEGRVLEQNQEEDEEFKYIPTTADIFDEFLAQVSFKRTTEIDGYT